MSSHTSKHTLLAHNLSISINPHQSKTVPSFLNTTRPSTLDTIAHTHTRTDSHTTYHFDKSPSVKTALFFQTWLVQDYYTQFVHTVTHTQHINFDKSPLSVQTRLVSDLIFTHTSAHRQRCSHTNTSICPNSHASAKTGLFLKQDLPL